MAARRLRIFFHWSTTLLVAAAYLIAFYRSGLDDPEQRLFWLDCHRTIGLTVLGLTLLRLAGRRVLPVESLHEPTLLMLWLGRVSHVLLYIGLIVMPLLGWAQSSAKMRKFKIFGVHLPSFVPRDAWLGNVLGQWHEALGWTILTLIGLHSLAALYHHFVRRDRVLLDMLTARSAVR